MKQRSVLVLNHFAVPRGQPGGTRHVELFGRLPGWTFTIIASRRNMSTGLSQPGEPGFRPVWVFPHRGGGAARVLNWVSYAVTATITAIRQPRPDVVYASSPHLLAGLAGWLVSMVRRVPFVLEIRDLWPQVLVDMGRLAAGSATHRFLVGLERFLYLRADRIVALATATRDHVSSSGVSAELVSYIPNAADPADFEPSADRTTLRRRFGFTGFTAVYTGAHGLANGLDLLLDAAADLRGDGIDVVLVGDGGAKRRLIDCAGSRELTNVRFLAPLPKTQMPDLLAAADLGIHVLADVALFRTAVSPNKVFDYLAAGLPVVTNVQGVIGDLVTVAGAGWAVGPHNLAEGIRKAATLSVSERTRLGANGREWIAHHQSRALMVERLRLLLDDVSAGRHAGCAEQRSNPITQRVPGI